MWLSEQKPDMFALKLKFILLSQLIATLNNYACSLPPLAKVCFPWMPFADHVNPRLVKWRQGGLQVSCEDLIWLPLSEHVCLGLVVEYWPFVSASTRHSYSKLYYLCLLSFWLSFFHHPRTPPAHPLIYTGPILMNSIKKL